MSEDKFECIVVGGGLAGLTAAYMLANAGREVMLVERGNYCGSKNVTGGRMYGHSMEKIIPGFAESAPVERRIVRERLSHDENGSFVTEECESRDPLIENGESFLNLCNIIKYINMQWSAQFGSVSTKTF